MAVLVLLLVMPAHAEVGAPTPTVQAVAADATWLAYTPPPAHPGIVCMVDSGVDPNPDTEAAVIGGEAIAPETDTHDEIARLEPRVQPGDHPDGHGTLMAMMMAAPANGWGMVGIAPTSVRVYNMKALPKGEMTFTFSYYAAAVNDCQELRESGEPATTVVNLSLGGTSSPGGTDLATLGNFIAEAERSGLNVVAAAGNEGGTVLYPAAYRPILAVGAGDISLQNGTLCSFASRGEELDLVAPGCDDQTGGLQGAFENDGSPAVGAGSSQASALVSAVLASIRAYAPQLTSTRAEECLTSTAKNGLIDIEAAFEVCGLSHVVTEGKVAEHARLDLQAASAAPMPAMSQAISPGRCDGSGCTELPYDVGKLERRIKCPLPRIASISRRGSRVMLRPRGRVGDCRLQARWHTGRHDEFQWRVTKVCWSSVLELPSRRLYGLQVRYVGNWQRSSSRWVAVAPMT